MNKVLLTLNEAAGLLRVSKRTLQKWVYANKIPFVVLNREAKKRIIRFRMEDLDAWVQSNRKS